MPSHGKQYAEAMEQPPLHRKPSSSYPGQRQSAQSGSQYAHPHAPDAHEYAQMPYAAHHATHGAEQSHSAQHLQRPDEQQYYHDQPYHDAQDLQPVQTQAAYPASAYPYAEAQPPSVMPPTTESQPYAPTYQSSGGRQTAPLHESTGEAQSYQQQAPQSPEQHVPHVYDEHGNKLRLQGYYKPSSFPAVPEGPVGGVSDLPEAPIGELNRVAEQFARTDIKQERRQEEALIEF